jgi:hypothetical protein
MPTFAVRFKGLMTGQERERLGAAGIKLEGRRSSMIAGDPETGTVRIGRPIYTVVVEAASESEALARVREAIEPDLQLLRLGSRPVVAPQPSCASCKRPLKSLDPRGQVARPLRIPLPLRPLEDRLDVELRQRPAGVRPRLPGT